MFHVSLLRRYQQGGDGQGVPEPIWVEDGPEYEVERILEHRARRSGVQYLIRWKGYDPSEDSWLPESDLRNAPEVLNAYKRSVGL